MLAQWLACRTANGEVEGSNPGQGRNLHPVASSAMLSAPTVHRRWEDETLRERTGHPPTYAKAKRMKSLTLHTHSCHTASLKDCSSFSSDSDTQYMSIVIKFSLTEVEQLNGLFFGGTTDSDRARVFASVTLLDGCYVQLSCVVRSPLYVNTRKRQQRYSVILFKHS